MPSRRRAEARRGLVRLLDAALVAVAVAGLLVVVARLVGAALGLELVAFATGSMAPAYPQGSMAIAQRAALEEIRVGDVVMLDRRDALPITHRVVAVEQEGDRAVLRLRGDANRHDDPTSYRVDRAARIVLPLPAALGPVRLLGTPEAAGSGALLAALAVGWGLWPRRAAPAGVPARA